MDLNGAEEQTNELTRKVDSEVRERIKKKGNLLVDAWLGGTLAQGIPGVLKILLIANDKVRFERFAKREKTSIKEAGLEVKRRDSTWFKKVKQIHGRDDFFDKKLYDLVIDTSFLSEDAILNQVLMSLRVK